VIFVASEVRGHEACRGLGGDNIVLVCGCVKRGSQRRVGTRSFRMIEYPGLRRAKWCSMVGLIMFLVVV
jgi:hypothetical protein